MAISVKCLQMFKVYNHFGLVIKIEYVFQCCRLYNTRCCGYTESTHGTGSSKGIIYYKSYKTP